MERLAQAAHVRLKLSGLMMTLCGHGYEHSKSKATKQEVVDRIGPHIEYALKLFGVDRCMFTSNFPVDKISTDFATLYDVFFDLVSTYSAEDQEKLFYGNAVEFYSINV